SRVTAGSTVGDMAMREGHSVLGALAAVVIGLAGYLAGRTLYERATSVLIAHGVSTGTATPLQLPVYVALVVGAVAVGSRVAAPLPVRARLRSHTRAGWHVGLGFALGAGAWIVLLVVGELTGAATEVGRPTGWDPHVLSSVVATALLLAII